MSLAKHHALVTGSTSGIGLAIARALAKEGADVVINRFGDKAAIEAERAKIEKIRGQGFLQRRRHGRGRDRSNDRRRESQDGSLENLVDNAGIQHVSADQGLSTGKVGVDRGRQPYRGVPRDPRHSSGDEGAKMRPHRLDRLGPFARRLAVQVGLCIGQARSRRLAKTVALELATFGVTANCVSPGYVSTPLVERHIPDTMKARNMTREQVINDVMLAAQPTKQFVSVDQVAALAVFLCSDAASQITGANLSIDGGWTAG